MQWIPITSSVVVGINDFTYLLVALLALQMSIGFHRFRSGSLSSLLRDLSHFIPQTILSLIRLSLKSWNLLVCAFFIRSVTYWSMVSSSHWNRVLNTCHSHVMFVQGMQ